MDGIHDLGGLSGFGAVEIEPNEPVFHERWEARAFALNFLGLRLLRAYNVHEYRHAVERMHPALYLAASYYERWLTGVATLFVEKGIVPHAELEARAGGPFPLARPAAAVRAVAAPAREGPCFAPGDAVRVRDFRPAGHTRAPRYVRGKRGVVVRVAPRFEFPDLAGHAIAAHHEHTYQVEFPAAELWADAAESGDSVIVDLWESYLQAAS
ncbi:MAG: nitrile hydratase subunit beta [Candidatus Binatia bacterium]